MANYVRYCRSAVVFAVVGMVGLAGCQENSKNEVSEPVGQNRAVVLDCIVEYYNPDGSRYVSEQTHKINFNDKILHVSANEPAGKFEWLLKDGVFTVSRNSAMSATESITLCDENIAKGLLGLYIANVNNMGRSLAAAGGSVKIQGRRYQKLTGSGNLTFCRNLDTSIIDTVLIGGIGKKHLMLRGYGYKEVKTVSGAIPTRIEIFRAGAGGADLKPLVRYNGVIWE